MEDGAAYAYETKWVVSGDPAPASAIRRVTPVCPECLCHVPEPAGLTDAIKLIGVADIRVKVACGCGWTGRERFYVSRENGGY